MSRLPQGEWAEPSRERGDAPCRGACSEGVVPRSCGEGIPKGPVQSCPHEPSSAGRVGGAQQGEGERAYRGAWLRGVAPRSCEEGIPKGPVQSCPHEPSSAGRGGATEQGDGGRGILEAAAVPWWYHRLTPPGPKYYHRTMRKKHLRTLETVFVRPTASDLRWQDVEALLKAVGAEVEERAGSRVAVVLNEVVAVFHRPHPRPEMDKGAVVAVRKFLTDAGVVP